MGLSMQIANLVNLKSGVASSVCVGACVFVCVLVCEGEGVFVCFSFSKVSKGSTGCLPLLINASVTLV